MNSCPNKPRKKVGNNKNKIRIGVETQNWQSAKVRWALSYPELYEVGASNLGHIILYSILNTISSQLCDRLNVAIGSTLRSVRLCDRIHFAFESTLRSGQLV